MYKSSFVGSILYGKISINEAVFKSDSISTITIIKEAISSDASARSININITWDLNDESVERILKLLAPKYDFHHRIAQQFQMIPALKELTIQVSIHTIEAFFIYRNRKEITRFYLQNIKRSWKMSRKYLNFINNSQKNYYI